MPRRACWSPPTAAGAGAPSCRSRRTSTRRWRACRASGAWWSSGARATRCRWPPAATAGGTSWSTPPRPTAPPSRSTASTRSSSSTPAARPGSRRASCTRPAATCSTRQRAEWVFDLKDQDTFWCTADIGWVTGHSYVVYGPLANGATSVMYEGAPNHPQPDRFWKIIEELGVSVFYTAPTAIRAFVKWGNEWPRKHDLSSLRLLGTVGEPINPEAWMWYHRVIGGERCPIVDTWWQTETGGIMISPLPGAIPTKPGSATLPLPGVVAEVRSRDGTPLPANQGGYLVITRPWPGMLRTVYRDPERYRQQYWSQIPGAYFTGDGARRDADGYFWVMGRIDDVVNVAGHRLGTMEVESALVSHAAVAEAAVVGRPDELKGQALAAFVTLEAGQQPSEELRSALKQHVAKEIGAFARPDDIRFTDALPKTRSGKIMRRLLRDIAAGKETVGDTTTLEDYAVLARLREEEE